MLHRLKLKPDFDRTVARFQDWWLGRLRGQPLVTLSVKPSREYAGPVKQHPSLRDRWLDAEYAIDQQIARLEQQDWLGDAFPAIFPNVGPEITATLFGCELDFGEHTSWSHPIIDDPEHWPRILDKQPDFDNVYWQTIERMTRYALERNEGRYVVGMTDLHGNYDILAALREPVMLCTDLLDCPEVLQKVGRHVAEGFVAACRRQWDMLLDAGLGTTSWLPFHHTGPAYVPSCDFWCMVSPQAAHELILPDILTEMQPMERSIFHLDGPQALRHLDLLLDIPSLNAIQWVFGAGNGPASRWIDVYRKIIAAGKGVQVLAEDPADALEVLDHVGAEGVWLDVNKPFENRRNAELFLDDVQRACRSAGS